MGRLLVRTLLWGAVFSFVGLHMVMGHFPTFPYPPIL